VNLPYVPAKVYRGPKEWYVTFYYQNPKSGKFVRFRESYGLNKKRNIPFREQIAKDIVTAIDEELKVWHKTGFNPFPEEEIKGGPAILPHLEGIVEAWKVTESDQLYRTYKLMNNRFRNYLAQSERLNLTAADADLKLVKSFQRYLMETRKLAPKTVNTTISHMGGLFDELIRQEKATANPFRNVDHVDKKSYKGIAIDLDSEEDDFIPFTAAELDLIFERLVKVDRDLLRFYSFVYWGFMRPIEISRLKVGDIDLRSNLVRVAKPNAKNKSAAYVQILQPMRELLLELDLSKYPKTHFLFGSTTLLPAVERSCQKTISRRWNRQVTVPLEIDKKPYGLKHSGNIQFIINNKGKVDREWMKMQNRHKTRAQTDKYIERLNVYTIDESQYYFTQLPKSVTVE
jgi:integrase